MLHCLPSWTLWPSGLRRWLKAPFRKGVGSNPTGVILQLCSRKSSHYPILCCLYQSSPARCRLSICGICTTIVSLLKPAQWFLSFCCPAPKRGIRAPFPVQFLVVVQTLASDSRRRIQSRTELLLSCLPSWTLWPSGLRRWLKAPFRKGVGLNPTGVTLQLQSCVSSHCATSAS